MTATLLSRLALCQRAIRSARLDGRSGLADALVSHRSYLRLQLRLSRRA